MRRLMAMALATLAMTTSAAAQDSPREVSMRVHGGRMLVPVETASGETMEFILSTANTVTVLGESARAHIAEGEEVTMGGVRVEMAGAVYVPDAQLVVDGTPAAGIIGSNTLNRFDILLDARAGHLLLREIGGPRDWEGFELSNPVRMRVLHGMVLSLDVELNGRRYGAALDIGTPGNIVSSPVKEQLGLDDEAAATLEVGPVSFADMPITVQDLPVFDRFDPNGNGFIMVGAALALDCPVAISWARGELRTCVR